MSRQVDEFTYRARNAIRKRVEALDPAIYGSRLTLLRWRIKMLEDEWSISPGDELALKRKHLSDCIKLAEFEAHLLDESIAKCSLYGGENKLKR